MYGPLDIEFKTTLDINYFDKSIVNIPYINFLCLVTDDSLTWDNHTGQLISRLNTACYAITAVKSIESRRFLIMLYFPHVHLKHFTS